MAAAHICNRMPTTANEDNSSPYQLRYLRAPDLSHLQPFGITAYVHRMMQQPKVVPRADLGILLGYGHEVTFQKGYRIYLLAQAKVVTTSNVSFDQRLLESVHRRPSAWLSTTLPEFTTTATDTLSTQIEQRHLASPVQSLPQAPAASTSLSPSAQPSAPHPLCARGNGPTIVPSQTRAIPARRQTRSMTATATASVCNPVTGFSVMGRCGSTPECDQT